MNMQELTQYVSQGREIEFEYQGNNYSITYGILEGKEVISFCQFYQDTTEVTSVEELAKVERNGVTVLEMLQSLPEDKIWIY